MIVWRVTAFFSVFFLIVLLSLAGIGVMLTVGTAFSHGNAVEHNVGIIVDMGPGQEFTLLETNGEREVYKCVQRCLRSHSHMERHMHERAKTDIFYIRMPGQAPMAVDVD